MVKKITAKNVQKQITDFLKREVSKVLLVLLEHSKKCDQTKCTEGLRSAIHCSSSNITSLQFFMQDVYSSQRNKCTLKL